MDNPYDAPKAAIGSKRNLASPRLSGWLCVAGCLFTALLLCLNVIGCCLHLYTCIGPSDLILSSSIGVLHTAIAPHRDMTALTNDPKFESLGGLPGYWHTDLLKLGPFHLIAEPPVESFQPFRFDFVSDAEYTAVEFPMLAMVAAFGSLGWLLLRRRRVT